MNIHSRVRLKVTSRFLAVKFRALVSSVCLIAFLVLGLGSVNAFQEEGQVPPQSAGDSRKLVICDDGTIWATNKKKELVCFHDGKWKEINLLQNDVDEAPDRKPRTPLAVRSLYGGKGGMSLVRTGDTFFVCRPSVKSEPEGAGHVVATGSIHALLEDQGDLIRDDFSQPKISPPNSRVNFAFTKSGKIWCVVNFAVHVFDGEVWHDASEALISAGIRNGSMTWLSTIGDDRVFISNLKLRHDGGESFFGEFTDAGFKFTIAPHVHSSIYGRYTLCDEEGRLWLASTIGRSLSSSDLITGQAAVRVTTDKPPEIFGNVGEPSLVDKSGNLWLTNVHREKDDVVNIFRDGKVVQKIQIPDFRKGKLFCDRVGSVYAETEKGLRHIVVNETNGDKFRIAGLLPYPSDLDRPKFLGYSSQGGLVFKSRSALHLRRLSAPE